MSRIIVFSSQLNGKKLPSVFYEEIENTKKSVILVFTREDERKKMKKLADQIDIDPPIDLISYKEEMKPLDELCVLKEEIISSPQKGFASALSALVFCLGLIVFMV